MKLRGWTILWTTLGVAAAGVACVWVLVQFNLLPMQSEIWMDLHTGQLRARSNCLGLTIQDKLAGNFSSGIVPGANLSTYEDPLGRSEWIRVADGWDGPMLGLSENRNFESEREWQIYMSLYMVAVIISEDPRAGFKYDPPNGYSKQAKKYLLLNCLQVARETRDAELINQYYDYTVETLRPLDRKAYPDDLPDVDEFLEAHNTSPRH